MGFGAYVLRHPAVLRGILQKAEITNDKPGAFIVDMH